MAGLSAETAVERHYGRNGLPVVGRRWRGRGGEIDLIAADGDGLVFVEVKKAQTHDAALWRVTRRQAQRIMDAATEFVGAMPKGLLTAMRFDIATVDAHGEVRIVENAFAGY
ncbi:YraN family protein [Pelagovum pacificum]|uniref:Uncharacterized protein n=2 Tax=Pelagovum pacificum TaxID=2588711 RepID=A0A5C5GAU7_9RHOB|nr:YraN family protein [Pelagovum pacificum]QQA42333.1 YraN family protein [Pelagovum pacificum]TNY31693.1 hypothetical protein FHY64_15485 [Pelagovum pacificum]